MQATLSSEEIETAYQHAGIPAVENQALAQSIVPENSEAVDLAGSTDVADVSWVVPTVQLWGANYAIGTPFHSWQMTAQGKSPAAIKGMTHAAMIMASTGADLILNKNIRNNAWKDLRNSVGPRGYISPLLNKSRPPIKDMTP
jgi:aminobenzoyl-glutamate utilization protein B